MRAVVILSLVCLGLAVTEAKADMVSGCQQQTDAGVAVFHCTEVIRAGQDGKTAWAYTNRALARAAGGDYLKALADYDLAIADDPGFAPAYSNRGNAHAALGDMLKALADHERAIALDSNYIAARHNRAVDLEELGRYAEALAAYKDTLARAPEHKGSRVGLATASCKLGRVKASTEARLAAIQKGALDAVRMQRLLQTAGFYKGAIDGIFGKGSRAALWAWTRQGCLAKA